jgi:hypothetical protein
MFEARVEGSQPRFCSERFPGCMVETGAFMFSLSLCIFRAMLIGGSIAVAWERVPIPHGLERVSGSVCKYFDGFHRRGSIDLTCPDPHLHKQAVHIDHYFIFHSLDCHRGSRCFCVCLVCPD